MLLSSARHVAVHDMTWHAVQMRNNEDECYVNVQSQDFVHCHVSNVAHIACTAYRSTLLQWAAVGVGQHSPSHCTCTPNAAVLHGDPVLTTT